MKALNQWHPNLVFQIIRAEGGERMRAIPEKMLSIGWVTLGIVSACAVPVYFYNVSQRK